MRASGGRNTKVRTVPFDANLSVRMETTSVNVPFPCRAESPLRSRYMLLGPVETGDSYQKKPPTRTLRYETTLTDGVASTSNRSATLPAFPLVGLGLMNVCERVASSSNAV